MPLDEALLTGQISGRQLGQTILQLLPAFPHEGPPGMPRAMARKLFPGGFLVPQPATLPTPTPEIILRAAAVPAQPAANQVVRTQVIPQPAPAGYRSAAQGGEPIGAARSQRIRISERSGM